jgi:electron transfer flavoprotein beta subunit
MRVFPPQARGEKAIFSGSIDEQIDQLVAKLAPYL